jgi:phosphoribosylformimino-5-aminoimidazole carboxamide ribotide isomerase
MEIIPVIDLKNGTVVRARMGQRDQYRPIETPISPSSDPNEVVRGLLSIYPFPTLYVADLDAIAGIGDNQNVLDSLRETFPRLLLWVDNGIAEISRALDWLSSGSGSLVLGSETQTSAAPARKLARDADVVLSLDFRGDEFLGPPELLDDLSCWPSRVIVMTLARVGSGAGPDLARLSAVRAAAPDRRIYAAGGIRNRADLAALSRAGIAGALVATSLHDGSVTARDIAELRRSEVPQQS